ncbi:MAG: hypothetical protein MJK04_05055, partial [Psychrosphaera sp.]|nr:hypothetical protein [Psychrosphaera sp.]
MSKLIDIILPADQLEGTSATLSKWLVAIGAMVKEGDPIIELETDKVSMEICAPSDGAISEIIAAEGEEVQVDTVLGRMGEVQDSASSTTSSETATAQGAPTEQAPATQDEPEDDTKKEPHVIDAPSDLVNNGIEGQVSFAKYQNPTSSGSSGFCCHICNKKLSAKRNLQRRM